VLDGAEQADAAAAALLRAGLACLEVTLRTPGALSALAAARAHDGLLVGAGTVLDPMQVEAVAASGAHFAVSPALDEDVVAACAQAGLPLIPGVATPSEMARARRLGFTAVKVFPAAQLGGPAFLRAAAAAFADLRFLPTGGIGAADIADYLAVRGVLAVGGSWILAGGEIEERARAALAAAR
jgi:2-dehydro-3-deoxyphosphogluconate aldolase/(4S)-4-hydroxy-2-oxoglutarate aldolase